MTFAKSFCHGLIAVSTLAFSLGLSLDASAAGSTASASIAKPDYCTRRTSFVGAACVSVCSACEQAGFVAGEKDQGIGLIANCVEPIVKGTAQPSSSKKALPKVSRELALQCKNANPNWNQHN